MAFSGELLDEKTIKEIRRLHEVEGVRQFELVKMFEISQPVINGICNYRTYKPNDFDEKGNFKNKSRKLTDADKEEIVRRLKKGETQTALAKEFGCHKQTIWLVNKQFIGSFNKGKLTFEQQNKLDKIIEKYI